MTSPPETSTSTITSEEDMSPNSGSGGTHVDVLRPEGTERPEAARTSESGYGASRHSPGRQRKPGWFPTPPARGEHAMRERGVDRRLRAWANAGLVFTIMGRCGCGAEGSASWSDVSLALNGSGIPGCGVEELGMTFSSPLNPLEASSWGGSLGGLRGCSNRKSRYQARPTVPALTERMRRWVT